MIKTYQFRLYPNKSQIKKLLEQLECHKSLYNQCLELKINTYKDDNKNLSCFDQIKSEVPKFKGLANYASLQQTVRRLHNSYSLFFKNNSKFPRFKNRFRTIKYAKHGDGCKFSSDLLYLQNIGKIKCNSHRIIGFDEKIKTLSVTLKDGVFFVNLMIEKPLVKAVRRESSIGIDFGCTNTINLSSGTKIKSPKFFNSKAKDIARLQRKKLREPKNSRKTNRAIAKCYTKISNRRKDFNHKLTTSLVAKYDIICCEDLSVSELTCNISNINKRWQDIAICQIKTMLKYKAENAGKLVVFVNPAYTSQTCYGCGNIQKIPLSQRVYKCRCGLEIDRDTNASLNILSIGLDTVRNSF